MWVSWKISCTGYRNQVWAAISHLTHQAQNVSFPPSPLFPQGKHSVNIPLSCSVGDYKSKLQLYRDRRGHPSNPPPTLPLPSILSGTSSIPSDFPFPLASSLYCTNASCHWWSHLGLVCDLPPPCLSVQGQSRYSAGSPRKTNNTTAVLHRHTCSQGGWCVYISLITLNCV